MCALRHAHGWSELFVWVVFKERTAKNNSDFSLSLWFDAIFHLLKDSQSFVTDARTAVVCALLPENACKFVCFYCGVSARLSENNVRQHIAKMLVKIKGRFPWRNQPMLVPSKSDRQQAFSLSPSLSRTLFPTLSFPNSLTLPFPNTYLLGVFFCVFPSNVRSGISFRNVIWSSCEALYYIIITNAFDHPSGTLLFILEPNRNLWENVLCPNLREMLCSHEVFLRHTTCVHCLFHCHWI